MAFIGVFMMIVATVIAVIVFGVLPIIVGTILRHKTKYKKIGRALRIFGYVMLLPILSVALWFLIFGRFA